MAEILAATAIVSIVAGWVGLALTAYAHVRRRWWEPVTYGGSAILGVVAVITGTAAQFAH